MFGFACRGAAPCAPWPWKEAAGPAGEESSRVPRGLIGGQTVVLLTVWAFALILGVALAGPPGGRPDDAVVVSPAEAGESGIAPPAPVADPGPSAPADRGEAPPSARPTEPPDAGSDVADLSADDPWLGL